MKISHFATFLPKVSFLAISIHLMDIHYMKHQQEIECCSFVEPLFKTIGKVVLEICKSAILLLFCQKCHFQPFLFIQWTYIIPNTYRKLDIVVLLSPYLSPLDKRFSRYGNKPFQGHFGPFQPFSGISPLQTSVDFFLLIVGIFGTNLVKKSD